MTTQQIAVLELAVMAFIGAVLLITGILIKLITDRKNKRCTLAAKGKVIKHSFRGEGRVAPVIEFEAGGIKYTCRKTFTGIKSVRNTWSGDSELWEDEKGYLHVRTGAYVNMRQLVRDRWPVGSEMDIHYAPDDPKINYAGNPVIRNALCIVFLASGAGVAALGVLIYFLILHG